MKKNFFMHTNSPTYHKEQGDEDYAVLGRSIVFCNLFEEIVEQYALVIQETITTGRVFQEDKYNILISKILKDLRSDILNRRLESIKKFSPYMYIEEIGIVLDNGRKARNKIVHNIPLRLYEKVNNAESTHLLLYELCELVKQVAEAYVIFLSSLWIYQNFDKDIENLGVPIILRPVQAFTIFKDYKLKLLIGLEINRL